MEKLQRWNSLGSKSEKEFGDKMSDLSDDEGPEEVTFNDSKEVALKRVKDARDSVKRGKELLKEKRRKRQLLFQEQKRNRLLPETLLEEFDLLAQKPLPLPDEKEGEEKVEEEIKLKKPRRGSKSLQEAAVLLLSILDQLVADTQVNCRVMRVKEGSANTLMQKSAMDFIQAHLYGPGRLRTTNTELLSLQKKRGLDQGAAVQFANKKWGAEQKAKAEKCNKKFIHRQKLIPS